MKHLPLISALVAVVLAATALVVSLENRATLDNQKPVVTPTLQIKSINPGAFSREATKVKPGHFEGSFTQCPKGYLPIASGFQSAGPLLPTWIETDGIGAGAHAEAYNATDPLSTGDETGRLVSTVTCIRGIGIRIKGP